MTLHAAASCTDGRRDCISHGWCGAPCGKAVVVFLNVASSETERYGFKVEF